MWTLSFFSWVLNSYHFFSRLLFFFFYFRYVLHAPHPHAFTCYANTSCSRVSEKCGELLISCGKIGVPEADLCLPSDLFQGTVQGLCKPVGSRTPWTLWARWLEPLLRGPHASAFYLLHSLAPGLLGPEVILSSCSVALFLKLLCNPHPYQ